MEDSNEILKKRMLFRVIMIVVAFAVTIIIIGYSIMSGTLKFPIREIISLFSGNFENGLAKQIIFNVRLPRILTGLLVGMNLAVAGALLQGILRNPMASPNIIGVNAGAGLAAVIVMVIFPGKIYLIPIMAFLGSLTAALLVYALSMNSKTGSSTVHIVLAGIALSAFFSAITSGLMVLNSDEMAITYTWLLGSLSGRSWPHVEMLLPYSIVGLTMAIYLSPKVNLFSLGEEVGGSIGLSVKTHRLIIIATASILAGSAVSVAGTIGFIGLIGPHIARMIIGNDHRYLVPLSAILGGGLLVLSDTVARTLFQPFELAVGIVTAILGAPFFLFLLYGKKSKRAL